MLLTKNILKIQSYGFSLLRDPNWCRRQCALSVETFCQFFNRSNAINHRTVCQCCLRCVLKRNKQCADALLFRCKSHGKHTGNRPQLAIQTDFTDKRTVRTGSSYRTRCAQNAQKDWQIVMASSLFLAGGRQIDRNSADRECQTAAFRRSADTLPSLFDCRIRQTDNIETGQTVGNITFSSHSASLDTMDA